MTRGNEPCRAPPLDGRPFCFHHDPANAERRRLARARGGQRSRRPPLELTTASAADVRRSVDALIADTMRLGNSVKRNRAAGYLLSLALRALEVGELEERIAALEARNGQRTGQAGTTGTRNAARYVA